MVHCKSKCNGNKTPQECQACKLPECIASTAYYLHEDGHTLSATPISEADLKKQARKRKDGRGSRTKGTETEEEGTVLTDVKEALAECERRIRFSGSIYGSRWRSEEAFLRACRDALQICQEKWKDPECKPDTARPILLNIPVMDPATRKKGVATEVEMGFYDSGHWYGEKGAEIAIVTEWHEVPDGRKTWVRA